MGGRLVRNTLVACLVAVVLAGCASESADDAPTPASSGSPVVGKEVFVAHFQVPCTGVGEQTCLMVRESPDAEWEMRYDPIIGFDHEPGFEYRLIVTEETVDDAPADAPSVRWTLIEEVQATRVEVEGSEGIPVQGVWILTSFGAAAASPAPDLEAAIAALSPDRPVTLDLTESGRAAGFAGCNNYFAEFRVENGHQVVMGPAGATRKACESPFMDLEQAYLAALQTANMVFVSGDEMELRGIDGVLLRLRKAEASE